MQFACFIELDLRRLPCRIPPCGCKPREEHYCTSTHLRRTANSSNGNEHPAVGVTPYLMCTLQDIALWLRVHERALVPERLSVAHAWATMQQQYQAAAMDTGLEQTPGYWQLIHLTAALGMVQEPVHMLLNHSSYAQNMAQFGDQDVSWELFLLQMLIVCLWQAPISSKAEVGEAWHFAKQDASNVLSCACGRHLSAAWRPSHDWFWPSPQAGTCAFGHDRAACPALLCCLAPHLQQGVHVLHAGGGCVHQASVLCSLLPSVVSCLAAQAGDPLLCSRWTRRNIKGCPSGTCRLSALHTFAEQSPCLALQADLAGPSHATHLLCGAWQRGT